MLPYIDEAEVSVTSNDPSSVMRSRSGRKVVRNLEQQRWEFDVNWPDYLDDKAIPLEIALDAMRGQALSADLVHPVRSHHANASGVWSVAGAAASGQNMANVNGTGSLTIGHFLRFAGHSKVYRVQAVAGSAVTLYPNLRQPLLASEVVTVCAVPVTVTRTDDAIRYKRKSVLTPVSASFEEML